MFGAKKNARRIIRAGFLGKGSYTLCLWLIVYAINVNGLIGWWIVKLGLSFGVKGATTCIYGYLFIWWMSCIWDKKCLS